jgi:hypothetical protein
VAFKKLKKKLKKVGKTVKKAAKSAGTAVKKAAKPVGKALGTGLRIAAPILAATGVGLPIAAGAAVAGAALKGGDRKSKFKALKRTGLQTAGAAAVAAAAGAASGLGTGASILKSVPKIATNIFGGGGAVAPEKGNLDDAFITPNTGEQSATDFEKFLIEAGGGLMTGGLKPEDMVSDGGGLFSGEKEDPVEGAAPEQLEVDPATGEVRRKVSPLLLIGGAVVVGLIGIALLAGGKRKAG